jgi:hypothetical protein
MEQATVFIGSSSEGLAIARAIGEGLECCSDPTVWDEDVFEFGRGYLEELMSELERHDFAILVLSPDDVTESRGQSQQSPRDNVLFECGLFMGKLGRERTFIVCDKSMKMKLPSDLAGVTMLTYDSKRMVESPSSAVRGACMRINRLISKPDFRQLAGEWRSRYVLCYKEDGERTIEENVMIRPARGRIGIESKENPKNDNYVGYGKLVMGKHFLGEWESTRFSASAGGAFMLTLHPLGNIMYGFYVGPSDDFKIIYGGWVLAKKEIHAEPADGRTLEQAKEDNMKALLDKGEEILKETSAFLLNLIDFKAEYLNKQENTAGQAAAPETVKAGHQNGLQ